MNKILFTPRENAKTNRRICDPLEAELPSRAFLGREVGALGQAFFRDRDLERLPTGKRAHQNQHDRDYKQNVDKAAYRVRGH